MDKFAQIRQTAYEANMQLPRLGLVLFTFGNVSAVDRNLGVFAIKPSGVPYEDLTPEPIVLPPRQADDGYVRPPMTDQTFVPEVY